MIGTKQDVPNTEKIKDAVRISFQSADVAWLYIFHDPWHPPRQYEDLPKATFISTMNLSC